VLKSSDNSKKDDVIIKKEIKTSYTYLDIINMQKIDGSWNFDDVIFNSIFYE